MADESAEDGPCRVFPARLPRVSTASMWPNIQHGESHRYLKIERRCGRKDIEATVRIGVC
jgi:hypothetical protein